MVEVIKHNGEVAFYAPESKVLMSASASDISSTGKSIVVSKPSAPVYEQDGGGDFLKWYTEDNQYPQSLVEAVKKNEIFARGLSTIANAIYSECS